MFFFTAKLENNQRVRVYLSANESMKSYPSTAEETMQRHHFHICQALRVYEQGSHTPMAIGSTQYKNDVLTPILGDNAVKRGDVKLYAEPYTFNFLSNILRMSYVCDGKTVKFLTLRERLTLSQVRQTSSITTVRMHNTVGAVSPLISRGARAKYSPHVQMWAGVFAHLVDQMYFVSLSGAWPLLEGKGSTYSKDEPHGREFLVVQAYCRSIRKPESMPPAKIEEAKNLFAKIETAFLKNSVSEEREIWHPTLMKRIDDLYVKHVRPVKDFFGCRGSDEWVDAMATYWEEMTKVCRRWWKEDPHIPPKDTTRQAQQYALGRLQWIEFRREFKECMDLPWPTISMLEDMYNVLYGVSLAIQWVSTRFLLRPAADARETPHVCSFARDNARDARETPHVWCFGAHMYASRARNSTCVLFR